MRRQTSIPPHLATRLLTWLIRDDLAEEVLGDLEEKFFEVAEKKSAFRAKLNYWYQVINYLRPFAIGKSKVKYSNRRAMFRHYLKLSWRNLSRQRMYSSIKIGGFALGIAATLLIGLFIKDELNYDQHYKDGDRIFRLINVVESPEIHQKWTPLPPPIRTVLLNDFPQIETAARMIAFNWHDAGDNQFRPADQTQSTYEKGFVYADPELLEILEIPMMYGDRKTALDDPNTMVISRRIAEKHFTNQDPRGKIVFLNENKDRPYTITGVMSNLSKSHLQGDFLITLSEREFWNNEQTSWKSWNYTAYIKLKPGVDVQAMEENLLAVRDNYLIPDMEKSGDQEVVEMKKHFFFELQPIREVYLTPKEEIHDDVQHGDMQTVWLFGGIAVFILLLACINFINLSTARSANRAKEVGLQKVVGSLRTDVIRQFLTESVLFSLISFFIAILIVWLSSPFFNDLAGKELTLPWNDLNLLPFFVGFILLIGILSGLYPSLYLSSFRPVDVLKGSVSRGSKSSRLRSILVVFQFATSIVLIICTFITYRQMDYMLNKNLGFDKDQVVMLQGTNTLGNQRGAFISEMENLPAVKSASVSEYLPIGGAKRDQNSFWNEGKRREERAITAQKWRVDYDYTETLGMKIIKGRNFSENMASDSSAMIINETMAKEFGFEDPIGKRIENGFEPPYHIIGVVEDFHFESMKGEIDALSLVVGRSGSVISVKIGSQDMDQALMSINELWDDFQPNQPMRYTFLDQSYAQMYDNVNRTGRVFTVFSVLAIIVACLGLFALSAFMVEQRSKEISIRKVLGASLSNIFGLLTFNFLRLVLVALIIAIPVGWYMMKQWLNDYVYRIDITWDVFVVAGVIALLIALLTISSESVKAGLANPADKLRSE